MTYQHNLKDVSLNTEQEAHMVIDNLTFDDIDDLSETLEEKDHSPHEYLTIEQSLQFLKITKSKIFEYIGAGLLRPCFLYDGNLIGSQYMGHDIEAFGYFRFRGYITPTLEIPVITYLQENEQKFNLHKVSIVEILLDKKDVYLTIKYEREEVRQYQYNASSYPPHKICTEDLKEISATFNSSDCMLIKGELIKIKDKLAVRHEEQLSTSDEIRSSKSRKLVSDKELFEMIVPTIVRYIRLRDQVKVYPEADGRHGFSSEVKNYIQSHPNLKFLYKNFKDNWQKTMRDTGMLYKIFEEKL